MRTVLAVTIALALCGPSAAWARTNPTTDLSQMVSAYQQVQVVRVVERFENGAVATVEVMPSGQYRVASTGGQDPALIVQLATKPVPSVDSSTTSSYTTKSVGAKTIDGVKLNGYTVASADGSYTATVWVNERHLPVQADVQTQGHKVNLQFGDYNNSMLIGVR
jgi:hypothetical protein